MKNITVLYHSADFDGLFCREIARRYFGERAEYIGWDWGQPIPAVDPENELYMLDLSIPELMRHPLLTWIDHHATAIAAYDPAIRGFRIDGVAACRLAWQWFFGAASPVLSSPSLGKEEFIDGVLDEPRAVRLAGEHDVWDHRDPDAALLQHGLRCQELTPELWDNLLGGNEATLSWMLKRGAALQYAAAAEDAGAIRQHGFTVEFEGRTFLALNTPRKGSGQFAAGLRPEHEGCLKFNWNGLHWDVSLYSAPGRREADFTPIALKYGGGGHKQACGFRCASLPFMPPCNLA